MTTVRQHTGTGRKDGTGVTMRAVVQRRYGPAEVLHLDEVPRPEVTGDGVLVRVHAAGLDRGTWHLMTGLPYLSRLAFGLRRPKNPVPGSDVAGTVVAVGPAVTRFTVGDEVYGTGRGTFAEYTVAEEKQLARKPANLSFAQAAVVPVSASTALQGLDAGRLAAGQKVLVVGASGGVGSYAVQLAKAAGAEVTGVASAEKLDLVRALGADHVIDYRKEDWADGAVRYDLVLDIAGNPTLTRLRRALTPTGAAVITGGEEGGSFSGGMNRQLRAVALSLVVRQRLTFFVGVTRASDLERLTRLIEDGRITPSLGATYPLDRAAEAMSDLAGGRVRGKAAIAVAVSEPR